MRALVVLCFLIIGVLQGTSSTATQVLHLVGGASVNMEVGPEDAIYCRLEDPSRAVFYDSFGRCVLNIERVNFLHTGFWRMYVGLPEKIVAELYLLNVRLVQEGQGPEVRMSAAVSDDGESLTVSCSLTTTASPRVCKFRDPRGQILVPHDDVVDGRYSFHGDGVSDVNGTYTMDCGLRISSPNVFDLGIWRCGVDTERESRFGFLLVNFTSVSQDFFEIEPVLKPNSPFEEVVIGYPVAMTCTIPSRIRYCYFRSENGTILTISPGESTDSYEYVGNGFDAGECGLRLKRASTNDAGAWSCHVGLVDGQTPEQNATTMLWVNEVIVANLNRQSDRSLLVSGLVRDLSVDLEYCRFVRNDGFGFTNELVPEGYEFIGTMWLGRCEVRVSRPTTVDMRRWTVAARIKGQSTEVVARTQDLIVSSYWSPLFVSLRVTIIILCFGLIFIAFGLLLGPKKNRQWTYARAAAARDSIRRSLRKTPKLEAAKTVTSPQAA